MFNYPLRLSARLIAIYAIMCLFWVGFANWVAPNIAAYDELNSSIFYFIAATPLAAVLHLVIVLFICSVYRKHQVGFVDAARPYSHVNAILVVFSAAFLALAVLSGAQGDYEGYLLALAGRELKHDGYRTDPYPAMVGCGSTRLLEPTGQNAIR